MRHGMTLGELMQLYNEEYAIGCRLTVVSVGGWGRNKYFDETGLPWVLPSPNMPMVETALVYPGQVMLKGTNVSEGRGTTRPFEIFGGAIYRSGGGGRGSGNGGFARGCSSGNQLSGRLLTNGMAWRAEDFKVTFWTESCIAHILVVLH